jgi:predicted O-methyltransferase YrrM
VIGASRILEVGVFTGVGTLWMAHAAGPGGNVIACDVSEEFPSIGMPFWIKAGVRDRIELRIAPAQKTLEELAENLGPESVDFCYIDADKESYGIYYEQVVELLRPGGIVALDNMLLGGRVADPARTDPAVEAIRKLNAALHTDDRVDTSFLPMCDGVYLVRKR